MPVQNNAATSFSNGSWGCSRDCVDDGAHGHVAAAVAGHAHDHVHVRPRRRDDWSQVRGAAPAVMGSDPRVFVGQQLDHSTMKDLPYWLTVRFEMPAERCDGP